MVDRWPSCVSECGIRHSSIYKCQEETDLSSNGLIWFQNFHLQFSCHSVQTVISGVTELFWFVGELIGSFLTYLAWKYAFASTLCAMKVFKHDRGLWLLGGTRLKSSRNSSLSWIVRSYPQMWTASTISY